MIEKYGTDLTQISPSDDQLRSIKKIAGEKGIPESQVKAPTTFKEANEIIDHLEKYGE
jgi:hypothetical protein